jgi:hypothetical protein
MRILIVGSGKRVRETALPALHRISARLEVRRIFARTQKTLDVEGHRYEVEPIAALDARAVADADLVYVAVGKDAVPRVLAHLTALDVARVDILIDTPVVRFKHFRHSALLARFRNAWVAEDCAYLPWFDVVREACARGPLGPLKREVFDRSAYAYHGLASAKALFGSDAIVSGRKARSSAPTGNARRVLDLRGGGRVEIIEPRDYSVGCVVIEGERGVASDRPLDARALADLRSPHTSASAIEVLSGDGECRGFRIANVETHLDADESSLTVGAPSNASLTARMEAMKRVGFLRLLRAIAEGRGAYPIASGIDDMVVDYYLEKLGWWRSTAITSPSAGLGRALLGAVSRLGGG